jgi:putative membrane protein
MYWPATMAFLHHLAAFGLVGALTAEVVLFKPPLTVAAARRIQRADLVFGVTAGAVLIIGLLRVFFFEKGPHYYFADLFFLIKLSLFLAAGLISIYPTMIFLAWNKPLKQGEVPAVQPAQAHRVRMCLMFELTAVLVILLCAALMARGFGVLR